jgi:hypothetical protein
VRREANGRKAHSADAGALKPRLGLICNQSKRSTARAISHFERPLRFSGYHLISICSICLFQKRIGLLSQKLKNFQSREWLVVVGKHYEGIAQLPDLLVFSKERKHKAIAETYMWRVGQAVRCLTDN